ncbi:MAG: dihydroorotase, partial [Flavobacteriales bacterium CG_4_9_14_3_um_filter_40_17]
MNILLKSATIIDSDSPYHLKVQDVLIENGIISKIGNSLKADAHTKVIQLENLHASQGWFDSSVQFGEPGFEERETLENG